MWAAGRKERGKGKRSRRRGRKNQEMVEGLRARTPDLDPISRIPYGPAANKGCIKRPDIRQYLAHCHQLGSESALAHMGASTYHLLSTVLKAGL